MFSTKLSGFLIFACFPLVMAYALGSPALAKRLPDPLGTGLIGFHEDVNKVAATGLSGVRYGELVPVRGIQEFFQRMKDDAGR